MEYPSWSEIHPLAEQIVSAVTATEGESLFNYAKGASQRKKEAVIVEIGSNFGRSSVIIGKALQSKDRFYCIDPFIASSGGGVTRQIFFENISKFNIATTIIEKLSWDATEDVTDGIDFLFIDGDHRYSAVKRDIKDWIPKLNDGAIVVFHDYNSSWGGVRKAVDEAKLNLTLLPDTESMRCFRKDIFEHGLDQVGQRL